MARLPCILLTILSLTCVYGYGATSYAKSSKFFAQAYMKKTEFLFERNKNYPIILSTDEGHFVIAREEHDFAVFLPNKDRALPGTVNDGQILFQGDYVFSAERAYLVFPDSKYFPIISETEDEYTLKYRIRETTMHCTVPKSRFDPRKYIRANDGSFQSRKSRMQI